MGKTALEWIGGIQPAILIILASSACIAILAAIVRYFAYEHGRGDVTTMSTRVMHVFGYILVICALAFGGMTIAKSFEKAAYVDDVNGNTGKAVIPDKYQVKGDKTLGDLIKAATEENQKNREDEAGNVYSLSEFPTQYGNAASSNDYDKMRTLLAELVEIADGNSSTDSKKSAKKYLKAKTGMSLSSAKKKLTESNGTKVLNIDDATLEKYKNK